MRIDAHQHYWQYDPVRDAWITEAMGVLRRDWLPADAAPLLRGAGIDGVVAVQADQSEAETDFLLDLAERHSFIRGVVGWIDLLAGDCEQRTAKWSGARHLKGFRHIAQAEADDFLARDDFTRGVQTIGAQGYSYDILIYPPQLPAAAALVSRCPEVQFILDHCAKPAIAAREIATWREGITRLAKYPNVACKLSGLVTEATWHDWTGEQLTPYLDAVLDAFGPHRLLFGSDWPVCLLAADYPRVVEVIDRWSGRLSASDRDAIFGGTACAVYRLEE